MKADIRRQWRLLDLQKLDSRLAQVAHRTRTLPVLAELEKASSQRSVREEECVLAQTAVGDVEREIRKADADVQLVRDRADRDQSRLDAGRGSAKELQGLQHELETLARRQSELEDVELEVMERAESLRAGMEQSDQVLRDLTVRIEELTAQRDSELQDLEKEREEILQERANVAPGVGADLLELYEKVRERQGGLGAAPLQGRRCGGCGLELNQSDLARIRAADDDEVLRCEECRRILIRAADSGL
ncbi:zinc ribbon domain-containing protein [Leekyejoonella antrihumi]|uniref:Uncharacterized protein n=1 Tax=Leekyejoonella antrihumi TaxID=1660198 RepID=A0A563E1Q2_9MICO|nr:C4-type zinc ribbon domain-containing protein [Leekyejoonella antrihumi]TWP36335.1 hypothetical protein FGL98_10230 [Leekyejoonella antrihumi]